MAELARYLLVHTVHGLGGFGFLGSIDRFGTGRLHLVGQFETLHAGVQIGVFGLIRAPVLVHRKRPVTTALTHLT